MSPTTGYPEHHEGVRGIARNEPWLSLEEDSWPIQEAIIALTRKVMSCCTVGNPAPSVTEVWQKMKNPQVGDFVVEPWVYKRASLDKKMKSLGYLVAKRTEWAETEEEFQKYILEDPDYAEDRSTDIGWYIQYGPNPEDVCRWTNCDIYAVPFSPDEP